MIKRTAVLALSIALATAPTFAQEDAGDASGGSPFHLDPILVGALLGTAVSLTSAVFHLDEVAEVNRIDFDGNAYDAIRVNGFDHLLMNPYSKWLMYVGTGMSIASILMPAVLVMAPKDEWITIGTMYAETMLMAYGLKELGKICVNRPRPYMYFDGYPQDDVDDGDWHNSFPSGHTTLAFAGATFTSYIFSQYFSDSGIRLPMVASFYVLAFGTAAFRIASGSHFLTDVIAGAAIGTACGFFVPWLHTLGTDDDRNMSVQASPTGMLVSFTL